MLNKIFILIILVGILPLNGNSQSNFSAENYIQFLRENKDLESQDFLERFTPGKDYYSAINNSPGTSDITFFDSIKIKYELTESELSLLMKNQFVVSERLSFDKMTPALDDIFQKDLPVFVSSDAILHALHISYGNLLRDIEMQVLLPELRKSVDALYAKVPDLLEKYGGDSRMEASLEDVDLYITIAKSLLDENRVPSQIADQQKINVVWEAIDSEAFVSLPLFTEIDRQLDFSQFTIRGHYALYEELQPYFKCMMWLGRMEFVLADAPKEWYEAGFNKEGLRRLNIDAILLNELLQEGELLISLSEIDRIIGFMVGESDNMRPGDFSLLVSDMGVISPTYLMDDDNFDSFIAAMVATPEYQQKILSGYMKGNPETLEPTPLPVSYRLMGQRFIIDSYIFYKLVYDNVVYQDNKVCRMMPDPLDAMFALGNDNALPLLTEELDSWKYSSQLAGLRYLVDSYDSDFWSESLYNNWLQAIRLLSPGNETGNLPLFMKTVAWQQEKLNTQLASWTQLRHDNLLYAKQSYTHGGECMYPHSYVEPYPDFYRQIASFAEMAGSFDAFADIHGYATYESVAEYFSGLKSTMLMLEEIARKELDGVLLNEEELRFLGDMLIEGNGSGPEFNGWYPGLLYDSDGGPAFVYNSSESDFLIADVHTQPTDCAGNVVGRVLHVGVGKVNLGIFLAESPSNDYEPMAYVGPVMSYYEDITENFERLTDEKWTENVQEGLLPSRPDWVNVYLTDKKGEMFEKGRELEGVLFTGINSTYNNISDFGFTGVYPNPFTSSLEISYFIAPDSKTISSDNEIEISLFNIAGQKIKTQISTVEFGNNNISWDTSLFKEGIYFLYLRDGERIDVRKVVRLKN